MNPVEQPFQPGEVIADKYVVDRVLGRGGMGFVVAAKHLDLDVLVALKFLLPEFTSDPRRRARFVQEARAAIRIKSEHVAHVLDLGRTDSSSPFIVMEYLEGSNVADCLAQNGPFAVAQAVEILLQACSAITEAHALGIVHRDLKPSNLFLCRKGDGTTTLKVMDFGISKVMGLFDDDQSADPAVTRTGAVVGSPAYMAPEQIRDSKRVDGRADIWSLGVLLFELVTGRHPFENHSVGGLLSAIVATGPLPLSVAWPGAPVGLDSVVVRALCKSPEGRFQTAAEFADAIRPFASSPARLAVPSAGRNAVTTETSAPSAPAPWAPVAADSSMAPHSIALQKTLESGPPRDAVGKPPPTQRPGEGVSGSTRRRWLWVAAAAAATVVAAGGLRAILSPTALAQVGSPLGSTAASTASSTPVVVGSASAAASSSSLSPPVLSAAPGEGRAPRGGGTMPAAPPKATAPPHDLEGLIDERR